MNATEAGASPDESNAKESRRGNWSREEPKQRNRRKRNEKSK